MKENKLIDVKSLIKSKNPKLLKWLPNFIIKILERIIYQKEINQFLSEHLDSKNDQFCSDVVDLLQMKTKIEGIDKIPKEGGVVIVMNHPLGGMDALAFVSALREYRTDIKFIVNDILLKLEPLKDLFVGVNKHGKNSGTIHQQMEELFASGQAVCIFPAGLVSRKIDGKVRDLEWKKTFLTLSKKADIPVLPVYIDGKLSNFFYRLSKFRIFLRIKTNIEMLFLARELFKQKNVTVTFKVGKLIPQSEITGVMSIKAWAKEIRQRLYSLEKNKTI